MTPIARVYNVALGSACMCMYICMHIHPQCMQHLSLSLCPSTHSPSPLSKSLSASIHTHVSPGRCMHSVPGLQYTLFLVLGVDAGSLVWGVAPRYYMHTEVRKFLETAFIVITRIYQGQSPCPIYLNPQQYCGY